MGVDEVRASLARQLQLQEKENEEKLNSWLNMLDNIEIQLLYQASPEEVAGIERQKAIVFRSLIELDHPYIYKNELISLTYKGKVYSIRYDVLKNYDEEGTLSIKDSNHIEQMVPTIFLHKENMDENKSFMEQSLEELEQALRSLNNTTEAFTEDNSDVDAMASELKKIESEIDQESVTNKKAEKHDNQKQNKNRKNARSNNKQKANSTDSNNTKTSKENKAEKNSKVIAKSANEADVKQEKNCAIDDVIKNETSAKKEEPKVAEEQAEDFLEKLETPEAPIAEDEDDEYPFALMEGFDSGMFDEQPIIEAESEQQVDSNEEKIKGSAEKRSYDETSIKNESFSGQATKITPEDELLVREAAKQKIFSSRLDEYTYNAFEVKVLNTDTGEILEDSTMIYTYQLCIKDSHRYFVSIIEKRIENEEIARNIHVSKKGCKYIETKLVCGETQLPIHIYFDQLKLQQKNPKYALISNKVSFVGLDEAPMGMNNIYVIPFSPFSGAKGGIFIAPTENGFEHISSDSKLGLLKTELDTATNEKISLKFLLKNDDNYFVGERIA